MKIELSHHVFFLNMVNILYQIKIYSELNLCLCVMMLRLTRGSPHMLSALPRTYIHASASWLSLLLKFGSHFIFFIFSPSIWIFIISTTNFRVLSFSGFHRFLGLTNFHSGF